MTRFIEQLEKNSVAFASRLAVVLDHKSETVTYGELWDMSGKVYSYLKARGVGKEDFALINLPRGPKIAVALIGIWRAGAAGIITEKGYPAERVDYIKNDCNAKIVIDENIFNEMLAGETLNGFEQTDPHDACFAVYTSGTTGNPKGALHEYGKLELCIINFPREPGVEYDDNYLHAATYPLNFVVGIMFLLPHFYFGNGICILSYSIVKDIKALKNFIVEENISECFISPSLLKIYKDVPANLRIIYTGSDNVSDIHIPNVILKNGYGMSETAFLATAFTVDKPYHRTPVGKNFNGMEIAILDEDGRAVPDGEQGEICFDNPYFRGYINLPQQTERVFRGGIFHSNDAGYKDENGNVIISGRKDDMIKIHGNRVEPLEIEIVAKEILGVNNILAKGFADGQQAFIALYGLKAELGDKFDEKNLPALREKLSKHLPEYMIPNYYMALEKFPTNANGKISRKLFPAPAVKSQRIEYLPPVTETEKIICEKMAAVLGVEKISRDADFYQTGGDSLKTILFVTECDSLAIQSNDVYKYRTPEKLAAFCDGNKNVVEGKKFSPSQAMRQEFFPQMNEAYQHYTETGTIRSMYSSCFAFNEENMKKVSMSPSIKIRLNEEIDPARLQKALDKAVQVCPYAAFDITKRDGLIYFQKSTLPIVPHKLGTVEEFGTEKNNNHYVVVGFDKDTIEFVVSHILTDGFGINCFLRAVTDFYLGKEKTAYNGANQPDFVADLMSQRLPLPEGYEPKNYALADKFIPTEKLTAEKNKTFEHVTDISAEAFHGFCQKYGVSSQIAVSILLADAVQKAHPQNEKIISVRGPVNTRIPLQVPNTFQNASVPYIFLNFEPSWLKGELPVEALDTLKRDFADQYTYENLAAFTNRVNVFVNKKSSEEIHATFSAYKNQTDIFANFMGKMFDDDIAGSIKSFEQKMSASYPLMMYAIQYGAIISLQVIQTFPSTVYVESLRQVLRDRQLI